MITKIQLENFKGFKNFSTELTPVTIFGGRNNSGKTTILEAIKFLFYHNDPNVFFQMNYFRHMNDQNLYTAERLWEPLFYNFDAAATLQIALHDEQSLSNKLDIKKDAESASYDNLQMGRPPYPLNTALRQNYMLDFSYFSKAVIEEGKYAINQAAVNMFDPNYRPVIVSYSRREEKQDANLIGALLFKSETMLEQNLLAQWYGNVFQSNKHKIIIDVLKAFDKHIVDMQTIVKGAFGYLYAIFDDGRKLPVSYMGDGMNRLMNILLGILSNPGSIILLDEIENGFHYSMYAKLWEAIGRAAKENNCQIIANTHSADLLRGAVRGLDKIALKDRLSYIRLDNSGSTIKGHIFDSNLINCALESEMEVR